MSSSVNGRRVVVGHSGNIRSSSFRQKGQLGTRELDVLVIRQRKSQSKHQRFPQWSQPARQGLPSKQSVHSAAKACSATGEGFSETAGSACILPCKGKSYYIYRPSRKAPKQATIVMTDTACENCQRLQALFGEYQENFRDVPVLHGVLEQLRLAVQTGGEGRVEETTKKSPSPYADIVSILPYNLWPSMVSCR
jgi:hypothetical protein